VLPGEDGLDVKVGGELPDIGIEPNPTELDNV
jgi:hypothetical protein